MKNNFLGPLQAQTFSLKMKIDFIKKEFVTAHSPSVCQHYTPESCPL